MAIRVGGGAIPALSRCTSCLPSPSATTLPRARRPSRPLPHAGPSLRFRPRSMAAASVASDRKKVLVPIALGTEEMEAVILIDILRRAGAAVVVASVEEDLQVEASRRVKLVADQSVASCDGQIFDLVTLPGGMPGASRLHDCEVLRKIVQGNAAESRLVAAICAAPVVALQPWGILERHKAVCHPAFADKLDLVIPVDANTRVQRDGFLTTSQGPGTAMEFALSLVEQLFGKEKCNEVSGPLVLPSNTEESHLKQFDCQEWSIANIPKVLVPIANGSEEMEAVIIIDILRRAGATVVVASVEDGLEIVASRRVHIVADILITEAVNSVFDMIILPGGMPGAERLGSCQVLMRMLKEQTEAKRIVGAICAAPAVVLESNGLLLARKSTCHPTFAKKLVEQSAVTSRTVIDGLVITSQGPGTAMEFALSIVEKLFGQRRAVSVANAMVYKY